MSQTQANFEKGVYSLMGYALQRQKSMSFFEIFKEIITNESGSNPQAFPMLIETHKARLAQLYDLKKNRYINWKENILPYKIDDDDNIDIDGTQDVYTALARTQEELKQKLKSINDTLRKNFQEILKILTNFEDRKLIRERICRNLILFFKPAVFMITNSTYTIAAGPGTGKTYIANSLGKIFNALLIFSKPSKTYRATDFQGTKYGVTEMKVQKCFVDNMDSFVVIDEAHNFSAIEGYWQDIVKTFVGNIQDGDKGLIGFAFVGYDSGDLTIDRITNNDPGWKRRMQYRYTLPKFSWVTLYNMVRKNILDIYYGGVEANFPKAQKDAVKLLVQFMYNHNLFPDEGGDAKSAAAKVIEEIVAFPEIWLNAPNTLLSFVAKKYCEKVFDEKSCENEQQIQQQFGKIKQNPVVVMNQDLPPTLGQLYRDKLKKKAPAPGPAPAPGANTQGQKPKQQQL
jgi:hypothetical protein